MWESTQPEREYREELCPKYDRNEELFGNLTRSLVNSKDNSGEFYAWNVSRNMEAGDDRVLSTNCWRDNLRTQHRALYENINI